MRQYKMSELKSLNLGKEIEPYILKNLEEQKEELKGFEGLCTLKEYISGREENGKIYIENAYILLEYKGILLSPYKKHYNQNSYKFHFTNSNYPYDMVNDFNKDHDQPNYVSKPTEKKMNQWVEYLLLKEKYINERIKNKYNFKESYIKSLKDSGRKIIWGDNERTKGYIKGNGFEFHFTIGEKAAYTKIEFNQYYKKDGIYVIQNLETFDKLNKAME